MSVVEEGKEGREKTEHFERIYRPSLALALLLTTIGSRRQQVLSHLTIGDRFSSIGKSFSSICLPVRVQYVPGRQISVNNRMD